MLGPGDTLFIRGGTYRETSIRFARSGTETAPIVVRSYEGERAFIEGDHTAPLFELGVHRELSHIELRDLTIRAGLGAGVRLGENRAVTHVTIDGCEISDIEIADNTAAVLIETAAAAITVRSSRLSTGRPESTRGAGVELFRGGNDVRIEHNDIYASRMGVYYKHGVMDPETGPVIRYNHFHDLGADAVMLSTDRGLVEHNLLVDAGNIAIFPTVSANCEIMGAFYSRVLHNTVIGGGVALGEPMECVGRGARYTEVRGNLLHRRDGDYAMTLWRYGAADAIGHATSSDCNLFDADRPRPLLEYADHYTLTDFTAATRLDGQSAQAEARFVDAEAGDYRLADDSPGRGLPCDGLDVGVVGLERVGPEDGAAPSSCEAAGAVCCATCADAPQPALDGTSGGAVCCGACLSPPDAAVAWDAGADASTPRDAGAGRGDAGVDPETSGGCAAASRGASLRLALAGLIALALWVARRRASR